MLVEPAAMVMKIQVVAVVVDGNLVDVVTVVLTSMPLVLLEHQEPPPAPSVGRGPLHEEPARDEVEEDAVHPARHLVCAR